MTKAPAKDQDQLLEVQALDSQILKLGHRARTLPELGELETLGASRATLNVQLAEAERTLAEAKAALKQSEQEAETLQGRIDKNQQRLDGGTGSSKDLTALQADLERLRERRGDIETVELERMEAVETATDEVERLTQEVDGETLRIAEVENARDSALMALDVEREDVLKKRRAAVEGLDQGLYELYEKLRTSNDGVGAAALRSNRCEACGQQFSSNELQAMANKPDDEVLRCSECDRILVRV